MSLKISNEYNKVCEANLLYYKNTADQYDQTETCVVDPRFQEKLENELKEIVHRLINAGCREIQALDACGGSGNVSLKLGKMKNVKVTLCDQSPQLLDIFKMKCKEDGIICDTVNQEIAQYLNTAGQKFDLIIFSSALHHLENYEFVLGLALEHLNNHGFIFTTFDPVKWKFPAYPIVRLEYILFKLFNHKDVIPTVKRKIRKIYQKIRKQNDASNESLVNWGEMAEYHVNKGIDDFALVGGMEQRGLKVVWHIRETRARYSFFEAVLKLFGCVTSFKLLLQKA